MAFRRRKDRLGRVFVFMLMIFGVTLVSQSFTEKKSDDEPTAIHTGVNL